MQGPYRVQTAPQVSDTAGAYVLSRDGRTAAYAGRSDFALGSRLQQSIREGRGYQYFWIDYARSPMEAFQLECDYYHRFTPPDNVVHPAVPPNTTWRCQHCG